MDPAVATLFTTAIARAPELCVMDVLVLLVMAAQPRDREVRSDTWRIPIPRCDRASACDGALLAPASLMLARGIGGTGGARVRFHVGSRVGSCGGSCGVEQQTEQCFLKVVKSGALTVQALHAALMRVASPQWQVRLSLSLLIMAANDY